MNFESIDTFRDFGFVGGETITRLQTSCEVVPQTRGIYLVARKNQQPVQFLPRSTGGRFKGRDPTVVEEKLRKRWLVNTVLLYVGKAGATNQLTTLRGRLHSYMQFGLCRPCSHWGGRYIWQLSAAQDLLVFWRETLSIEPSQAESKLLSEFWGLYGQLPFANLRR